MRQIFAAFNLGLISEFYMQSTELNRIVSKVEHSYKNENPTGNKLKSPHFIMKIYSH